MSTQFWELPTNFIDGQTPYTGAQIERLNCIAETQTTGALLTLLAGRAAAVVASGNSFAVAAGTGLSVTIAAGMAIVTHPTYGPCWLRTFAPVARGGLPANSTRYLFAAFERSGGVDSRASGLPIFPIAETQAITGGVLLAKLTTGGNGVVVEDLRGALLGGGAATPPGSGPVAENGALRQIKVTTSNLASGATDATKTAPLGSRALIGRVQTSAAAWMRLYPTVADRAADAGRGIGNDSSAGVTVVFECVTLGASPLNVANCALLDPENDGWLAAITNLGGAPASVEVTFTVG